MTTAESAHDGALAYPVPVAARLIGMGPLGTWDLVREGEIRSFMEGGRRLISREALDEYLAKQREGEVDSGSDVVRAAESVTQQASILGGIQESVAAG